MLEIFLFLKPIFAKYSRLSMLNKLRLVSYTQTKLSPIRNYKVNSRHLINADKKAILLIDRFSRCLASICSFAEYLTIFYTRASGSEKEGRTKRVEKKNIQKEEDIPLWIHSLRTQLFAKKRIKDVHCSRSCKPSASIVNTFVK